MKRIILAVAAVVLATACSAHLDTPAAAGITVPNGGQLLDGSVVALQMASVSNTDVIRWESDHPETVRVGQNGVIVASHSGAARITARLPYGSFAIADIVVSARSSTARVHAAGECFESFIQEDAANDCAGGATWGEPPASAPTGMRGYPITVQPGTNSSTIVNGVAYSGHALDQMQGRGVPPSAVEEAIMYGRAVPGNTQYETEILDPKNGISVVLSNETARVVTVKTIQRTP